MNLSAELNPYPKSKQLMSTRIKQSQRQMGDISDKVRKQVHERSGGVCEIRIKCDGAFAREQAHLTGRKQLTHKTTADDLRDACVECHRWLDGTVDGIKYKRRLMNDEH